MIRVTQVRPVRPYVLEVGFSDGTLRHVDVERVLWGPVFEPLRDPQRFKEVYLDEEIATVAWPNGADLAPEYLHTHGEIIARGVST